MSQPAVTCFCFDDRERSLVQTFRRCVEGRTDVRVDCKRLAMGDVIVAADDGGGPRIIIERKILTDLVASVFDGRLEEQHRRMVAYQEEASTTGEVVWTVVLVEGVLSNETFRLYTGNMEPVHDGKTADGRYRLCVGTQLRLLMESRPTERQLFIRTSSEEETAVLLLSLARTALRETATVVHTPHLLRLPGRSRGPVFTRHLTATVGVSAARAARVAERFENIHGLIRAVEEHPEETFSTLCNALGGRKVSMRLLTDLGIGATVPSGTKPATHRPKKRKKIESVTLISEKGAPNDRQEKVCNDKRGDKLVDAGPGGALSCVVQKEGGANGDADQCDNFA